MGCWSRINAYGTEWIVYVPIQASKTCATYRQNLPVLYPIRWTGTSRPFTRQSTVGCAQSLRHVFSRIYRGQSGTYIWVLRRGPGFLGVACTYSGLEIDQSARPRVTNSERNIGRRDSSPLPVWYKKTPSCSTISLSSTITVGKLPHRRRHVSTSSQRPVWRNADHPCSP